MKKILFALFVIFIGMNNASVWAVMGPDSVNGDSESSDVSPFVCNTCTEGDLKEKCNEEAKNYRGARGIVRDKSCYISYGSDAVSYKLNSYTCRKDKDNCYWYSFYPNKVKVCSEGWYLTEIIYCGEGGCNGGYPYEVDCVSCPTGKTSHIDAKSEKDCYIPANPKNPDNNGKCKDDEMKYGDQCYEKIKEGNDGTEYILVGDCYY